MEKVEEIIQFHELLYESLVKNLSNQCCVLSQTSDIYHMDDCFSLSIQ